MAVTLDIVIVNWNSGRQLLDCLNSMADCAKDSFQLNKVIIVDNASTDNSLAGITSINLPITIINNLENKGFAYGCNQGGRGSQSDFILFLNPDTRLYQDSLSQPLNFFQNPVNDKIGIVGVQLIDEENKVARSCARFPKSKTYIMKMLGLQKLSLSHFMTEWDHMNNQEVDQIMGAFFLVRRTLYDALNGFDERFFVYMEEVDFSLRAKKLGFSSYFLAEAKIFHAGGGTSRQVKAKRLFYSLQSRILYAYKNFSQRSAFLLMITTVLLEPISRCGKALLKGQLQSVKETLQGYKLLWKHLPVILRKSAL